MALTGRAALLAALGSLPVGILDPGWTGLLAVNGSLALACACDYALAAPYAGSSCPGPATHPPVSATPPTSHSPSPTPPVVFCGPG